MDLPSHSLRRAKNVSTVRRLSRFLANKAIDVRSWYRPIAKVWLQSQFERVGEVRLIVDGTKIGFGHQLLMVSVAYRCRAVSITWSWVKPVRGHVRTIMIHLAIGSDVATGLIAPTCQMPNGETYVGGMKLTFQRP